jgi:hypothetical protein
MEECAFLTAYNNPVVVISTGPMVYVIDCSSISMTSGQFDGLCSALTDLANAAAFASAAGLEIGVYCLEQVAEVSKVLVDMGLYPVEKITDLGVKTLDAVLDSAADFVNDSGLGGKNLKWIFIAGAVGIIGIAAIKFLPKKQNKEVPDAQKPGTRN